MKPFKALKLLVKKKILNTALNASAVGLAFSIYLTERPSSAEPIKPTSANTPNSALVSKPQTPDDAKNVPIKNPLTGAELYSINCNRCHPERAPSDWTAAQWKTIMLQMQVRANIPAKQAKLILQFLQNNSGR